MHKENIFISKDMADLTGSGYLGLLADVDSAIRVQKPEAAELLSS